MQQKNVLHSIIANYDAFSHLKMYALTISLPFCDGDKSSCLNDLKRFHPNLARMFGQDAYIVWKRCREGGFKYWHFHAAIWLRHPLTPQLIRLLEAKYIGSLPVELQQHKNGDPVFFLRAGFDDNNGVGWVDYINDNFAVEDHKRYGFRKTFGEVGTSPLINVDKIYSVEITDDEIPAEPYSANASQPSDSAEYIYNIYSTNSSALPQADRSIKRQVCDAENKKHSVVSSTCANSCLQKTWPEILYPVLSKYDELADAAYLSCCLDIDPEYRSNQRSEPFWMQEQNDEDTEFLALEEPSYLQSLLDLHDQREAELLQLWQEWIAANARNGSTTPFSTLTGTRLKRFCNVTCSILFHLYRHFMRYLFPSPRGPGPPPNLRLNQTKAQYLHKNSSLCSLTLIVVYVALVAVVGRSARQTLDDKDCSASSRDSLALPSFLRGLFVCVADRRSGRGVLGVYLWVDVVRLGVSFLLRKGDCLKTWKTWKTNKNTKKLTVRQLF